MKMKKTKESSCTNNNIIDEIGYYVYLPMQWCSVSHFMWVSFFVCLLGIHRLAINKIEKQEHAIRTETVRECAHQTHRATTITRFRVIYVLYVADFSI